MSRKAQSSIEYLVTYGWMFVAVSLVGASFYAFASTGCTMQVSKFPADEIAFKNIGINNQGELVASLEKRTVEEVFIDKIRIEGESVYYNNRSKRLETEGTSYKLAEAEEVKNCREFNLTIVYDGWAENIKSNTVLTLPIQLGDGLLNYLPIMGGEVAAVDSNSTIKTTYSDLCIGRGCQDRFPGDENRQRNYVNRSGDTMNGTMETTEIRWECLGDNCISEEGSLKGYVNNQNQTVDGTLNLTEIKPITEDLCMGQTCLN